MSDKFAAFIARERARLGKAKSQLLGQQKKLAGEIELIERELQAITAYEAAKSGASVQPATARRRGRRGSRRTAILELLKGSSDGLKRGDIIRKMGLKGDKSGEQSISNALNALKKAAAVVAKDRKYRLAA